ncbi:alpha/beta fold hydrolase [soil metagenome]
MKKITFVIVIVLMAGNLFGQNVTGQWNGVLDVMGTQVRLVFHIEQTENGYSATFDSPDQGTEGIPFSSVEFQGSEVTLTALNIGAMYQGILAADSITGTWNQGGQSFPLNLSRYEVVRIERNRPQEPKKPYPYREEEVFFENRKDGIMLAGTLTYPDSDGVFPAVILISGSGPQNRDQKIFGHRSFLVLADHLTRHGFVVLRYDDRGTEQSTGDHSLATSADFATDVLVAVDFLKTRSEIDSDHIGLIGHSEGGVIAPLAANQSDDIAHIVLLAGTGIPGKEISLLQTKSLLTDLPFEVEDEESFIQFNERWLEIAASDQMIPEKRDALTQHFRDVESVLYAMLPEGMDTENYIAQQVRMSLSPWMQYFYNHNPSDELGKITIPVLSLNGSKDVQVDAKVNQLAIKRALEKAGNRHFRILELEGLNHMFQESESGQMNEYAAIEQTFSPMALDEITRWLKEQVEI